MAQDGSHGHQDATSSNERSFAPPPTAVNLVGAAENNNGGGSKIGSPVTMDAGKGKQVVPNAIHGGEEHGSSSAGRSRGKKAGKGLSKGESSKAADDDDGNLKINIIMERERRRKMKGMMNTLRDLMPHVDRKADQVTVVDETINFIKFLEQTKTNLEKKKQEQMLARQAAAAASSMSSMPRTAHGMAVMSDVWDPLPPHKPAAASAAGAGPVGFQTWSAPNVVLSVLPNDEAIINICAPKRPHLISVVLLVMSKYNIEVTSMQIVADTPQSLLSLNARVNGATGGQNPSAEDIYKVAVSEIVVRLSN